jgi:hypothetical protein
MRLNKNYIFFIVIIVAILLISAFLLEPNSANNKNSIHPSLNIYTEFYIIIAGFLSLFSFCIICKLSNKKINKSEKDQN